MSEHIRQESKADGAGNAAAAWIWLRNESLHLGVCPRTGSLVSLAMVESAWNFVARPNQGKSFRLLLPLEGRRNNLVIGEEQGPPTVRRTYDGQRLSVMWDAVRSRHGGIHAITVTQTIRLDGPRALFEMTIDNQSELTVENVWSPIFGNVLPPAQGTELGAFTAVYGGASRLSLSPVFASTAGYWGVDFPTQLGGQAIPKSGIVPVSPFCLITGRGQGLYVGVESQRWDVIAWSSELHPGYEDAMKNTVPAALQIGGHDVAIQFAAAHAPFIPPGEIRELSSITVQPFVGDWHAGAAVYRASAAGHRSPPTPPAWMADPHSWFQLHVNSPEDELRLKFSDLPRVARECVDHGIRAIQLVGWNEGGQDQGNPSHRPDERLGGEEDLRAAIAEIQELGVRVVLFGKLIWADLGAPQYRSTYAADAIKDPRGDDYRFGGYQYQTLTQLLDINTKRLAPMCFGSESFVRTCEAEFQRIVDSGADGVLFDEACWHGPAVLCFDNTHGHETPWPVFAGDLEVLRRLKELSDPVKPDFLFAGEGLYDWQLDAYHASYIRTFDPDHVPLARYLTPNASIITAVTGFDDRNMVNQCLLYRYLISYEPFNFKGRPRDFPDTVRYGAKMDELRTTLRDWFWDGEFCDTSGAKVVNSAGEPHHPYSVFINARTGDPGLAVANYGDATIELTATVDEIESDTTYRLVDDEVWRSADAGLLRIPARSAAVLLGQASLVRTLSRAEPS